jgi:hypothetical protein
MLGSGFTEKHPGRDRSVLPATTVSDSLPMFFQELSQPRLCNAQMRRLKTFPDFLAPGRNSGVVPPRFAVPNQIFPARLPPSPLPLVERFSTLWDCVARLAEKISTL